MWRYFTKTSEKEAVCETCGELLPKTHLILQYRIVVVSILRQNTQYRIEFGFAGIAHKAVSKNVHLMNIN